MHRHGHMSWILVRVCPLELESKTAVEGLSGAQISHLKKR